MPDSNLPSANVFERGPSPTETRIPRWTLRADVPTRPLPPVLEYSCKRISTPPTIDGDVDATPWPWSDPFRHIATGEKVEHLSRAALLWDDEGALEQMAVRRGHYPDGRSDAKGNEPEGIEYGEYPNALERVAAIPLYAIHSRADEIVPLEGASHRDVVAYGIGGSGKDHRLRAMLAGGGNTGLVDPDQFAPGDGRSARPARARRGRDRGRGRFRGLRDAPDRLAQYW